MKTRRRRELERYAVLMNFINAATTLHGGFHVLDDGRNNRTFVDRMERIHTGSQNEYIEVQMYLDLQRLEKRGLIEEKKKDGRSRVYRPTVKSFV